MTPANAREVAMLVLRRVMTQDAYAELALDAEFKRHPLSDLDRALTTELVYGVLRRRAYLDWRIDHIARTSVAKMELRVADALRLGAYQLLFQDRAPAYAAVNEAVKLVPRRAAGLVNAVLRKMAEQNGRQEEPELPDPLATAAIAWSCPLWLLRGWAERFGPTVAIAIARAAQQQPPATCRANALKMTRAELLTRLTDLAPLPTEHSPWGFVVPRIEPALRHPAFAEGMFVVQGEASQLVSELTGARPGERVLDLCAAPGGKTTHLAALVGAEGLVVATDVHPGRLRLLAAAVKRAGASNVAVKLADATAPLDALTNAHGRFDRVLVDAPCTAMGTLARHPEIKWRLDRADPRRLSETQIAILRRAAECVRSGGVLLYSVCSMSGEETERVVLRFLTERSDYALDDLRREFAPRYGVFLQETGAFLSLPHQSTAEGMFAARFVRE